MEKQKKYLVVGSSSILAKAIIEKLLTDNHIVTAVYNTNKGQLDFYENLEIYHISDIFNLLNDFDAVFFISAYIPRKGEDVNSQYLYDVNIGLLKKVCEKFTNSKIIYASSISVYGKFAGIRDENSCILNPDEYGVSKFWGELIVKNCKCFAIIRLSSIYGIGMNENTFIPMIIQKALMNKEIVILGEGNRSQNYINVDDAALIFVAAAYSEYNDIFLGVSERNYSNKEVALLITEKLPGVTIKFWGHDNTPSFKYDSTHTIKTLNLSPAKPLETGLTDLISWKKKLFS